MKKMTGCEYFRKALYLKFVQNVSCLLNCVVFHVSCYIPLSFRFSYLADAFIQSDLQMRTIEVIKTI